MSFTSKLFGSKPKVPQLQQLDLGTEQNLAVGQNATNLPQIENLANLVNNFSQEQWDKTLEAALPGYGSERGKISKNLLSLSEGNIPTDISEKVQNNAAYKSLAGGYGGSGAARNLVGRDLGLTSLDLMDKGLAATERWLSTTVNPKQFDVTSMFVTPAQRATFDTEERNMQFQRQWLKNQIKAMPDPGVSGWWNFGWGLVDSVLGATTGKNFNGMGQVNQGGTA